MTLPYLQSYNDPKKEKAYRRYMAGGSQRKIALALKIPARTVAHWSKADGWEDERQARKIAGDSPNVAAVAAGESRVPQGAATPAALQPPPTPETRLVGMERILARQQRLTGLLLGAYEQDVDKTLSEAGAAGKQITRSQIAQLTTLGNNLMALERKAWCVPDKIETKDTTVTPEDRVRGMKDDELERELAAAQRAAAAAATRAAASESVN